MADSARATATLDAPRAGRRQEGVRYNLRETEHVEQFYTCVYCDMPVLREGMECYDCRKKRPDYLLPERAEEEPGGLRRFVPAVVAAVVLGAVGFVTTLGGLGVPEGQKWVVRTGKVAAMAAVPDQCVVVGDARGRVRAFDEESGAERWRYQSSSRGPVADLAIAVDTGTVYFCAGREILCAVDLRTGALRWRTPVEDVAGPLALSRTEVLLPCTDELVAFDRESGWESWRVRLPGDRTPRSVAVSEIEVDGASVEAWVGYASAGSAADGARAGGGLCALDLVTGEVLWTVDLGAPVARPPLFSDQTVLVLAGDGSGDGSGRVAGIARATHDVLWDRRGVAAAAVLSEWVLYLVERDAPGDTPGGTLAAASIGESTRIVALATSDGVELWQTPLPGAGRVEIAGDVLYAGEPGSVTALRARSGQVRWTRTVDAELPRALAVGAGALYCATSDGQLRALATR